MRTVFFWCVMVFFSFFSASAQEPIENGFRLLDKGSFKEAAVFFESYLSENPEHKTAQICYGRAVGLSGDPSKATNLFAGMLNRYPGDFEVQINYNESFLWDKNYERAKPLYASLVKSYPDNFGALLGYANTLSNLGEYPEALKWVEKALALQPENANAKVSQKYMRMGYANSFVNQQDYKKGVELLQAVFTDFPEDKDALLNLANVYLITKETDKAIATYKRYATTAKDSITALNGIALAGHIAEKDKAALETASKSRKKVGKLEDTELTEKTYDRYVQALIWNRKFRRAKQQIDSLETAYPDRNWVRALRATLGMYTGDFKLSLANYDGILKKDSTSFDGNLGSANAFFASDKIKRAYGAAYGTLDIYENQKDALGFIEKLNTSFTPTLEERAGYTFDNGNNIALFSNTTAQLPLSTKFNTTASYQYRTTENSVTGNTADSHILSAGLEYRLFPNARLKTVFGLNNSTAMDGAYMQPVIDASLKLKPYKLQNLELVYQRQVQSFNADLIEREIVMNNYGLNYNLGTNFNLGWYTQLIYTEQTDANSRNLLFTSLYYNIFRKPALKMGVNYQYLSFAEQVPTIYFSPETYRAMEVFADFRGNFSKKTSYVASAATGLQQVEEDPRTAIFRAEAGLKHEFGKRFSGNLYGKYSNIASATAAGFEFTELGIKLRWLMTKQPLFHKKIAQY